MQHTNITLYGQYYVMSAVTSSWNLKSFVGAVLSCQHSLGNGSYHIWIMEVGGLIYNGLK